jgi:glycosyltransferase involved in cell wall biosynthesis
MEKWENFMIIQFILNGVSIAPCGGHKIVFEYANRLTQRGYHVRILFNIENVGQTHFQFLPRSSRLLLGKLTTLYYPRWFPLSEQVEKFPIASIKNSEVPDADVIVATAVGTAEPVFKLSQCKGNKLYLIQDHETWNNWTDEMVQKTYQLGMKNIVITNWLKEIVHQSGEESVLIPNGLDFHIFYTTVPIQERNPHTISMLYHLSEYKGSTYGIQALKILKIKYPDLKVTLFGVPKRPAELPSWIHYVRCATEKQLNDIYNHSAVYLCPSIKEGFGLTGAEAMACGCAYVASDYGGVHEYTEEGRNVLLSMPKDVNGLVDHISYLFDHNNQRIQLAEQGHQDIQKLNWDKSVDLFEQVIRENIAEKV